MKAKAEGYDVFVGEARWFLACFGHNGDDDPACAGDDNPDGSYMQFAFPVDESDPDGILPAGLCEVNSLETCVDNVTTSAPMGIQDAFVFLGCSPPRSAYFSFDMVVASRIDDYSPQPLYQMAYNYPGCPFGDALNSLSAPFGTNEASAVVQAFDNATAEVVRAALEASTVGASLAFHLHQLNSSLVRTWQNHSELVNVTKPDSFRPMVRWSVPDPSVPVDDNIEYAALSWPVLLLRKKVNEPKELLKPALLPRFDGNDENKAYGQKLALIRESLVEWMKTDYDMALTGTAQVDLQLPGMGDDWEGVLNGSIWTNDYLNTRDAVYGYPWYDEDLYGPFERVPRNLTAGGVAFFVGVVHTAVNKTLYNSVTLANDDLSYSHSYLNEESSSGTPSMVGSAEAFASLTKATSLVSESDLASLFTLAWRRNSSSFACPSSAEQFCETLPSGDSTNHTQYPADDETYLLLGDERAYLNPNTLTGPAPDELYGAVLLLFAPRS